VAVCDRDLLERTEIEVEVGAVANERSRFGAGIEKQNVLGRSGAGPDSQAISQIGDEHRAAGDDFGAALDDGLDFGLREGRLTEIGVADVVGDDIDDQLVQRCQGIWLLAVTTSTSAFRATMIGRVAPDSVGFPKVAGRRRYIAVPKCPGKKCPRQDSNLRPTA
jgi:hypothetical protein